MDISQATMRDYFAAQVIGHVVFDDLQGTRKGHYSPESLESYWGNRCARVAYAIADAMLQARDQKADE